jgi:hypothetical protein
LEQKELTVAAIAGLLRRIENIYRGNKFGLWDQQEDWTVDIDGALGEAILCKLLNEYWSPGTPRDPDTPQGIDVRATRRWSDGRLILHRKDADDRPFVLVALQGRVGRICGWLFACEGKLTRFWTQNVPKAAYFVDQQYLRPPETIYDLATNPDWRSRELSAAQQAVADGLDWPPKWQADKDSLRSHPKAADGAG